MRSDEVSQVRKRSDKVRRGQTSSDELRQGQTSSDEVRQGQTWSDEFCWGLIWGFGERLNTTFSEGELAMLYLCSGTLGMRSWVKSV